MTFKSYTPRASRIASILILAASCGLGACAPEEDDANTQQPFDSGTFTTPDASTVVTADAGTTPNPITPVQQFDSGVKPVTSTDSGTVVVVDSGISATPDGGAAPDAGGMTMMRPDQGMGDGKDVITIGDSWMNLNDSVGIQQSLEKASKRDYRNFGVPGTKLLDENIPNQYKTAKAAGPIKTVIMTGGGNDVLQDILLGPFGFAGCKDGTFSADCKMRIDEVAAKLQKMWADMAADGVQDVVIISYSNKTLAGDYKMVSSYSAEKITPICNSVAAPLRCSSFDTDMEVPTWNHRGDSIHPDDKSYDALGAGVWKLMQEKGMRR